MEWEQRSVRVQVELSNQCAVKLGAGTLHMERGDSPIITVYFSILWAKSALVPA